MVFISHAGDDTWAARQVASHVGEFGAQPFLDRDDNQIGERFDERLREVLSVADELVVRSARGIPIVVVLHGVNEAEFLANARCPIVTKDKDLIGR